MKKLIIKYTFLLSPFWILGVVFLILVANIDYNSQIPQIRPCDSQLEFDIEHYLNSIESSRIEDDFPYSIYLDSSNLCDVDSIICDARRIGKFYKGDDISGFDIITNAMTTELERRNKNLDFKYNPDSLIRILHWAMRFNHFSDDYEINKFQSILKSFWFNKVSNKLSSVAKQSPRIKYDFKFRYLVSLCHSNMFSPSIGNSNFEKVIFYFIDSNYCYMFNRFWYSTGLEFKLGVALIAVFQLYSFWCVFVVHFRKKYNS